MRYEKIKRKNYTFLCFFESKCFTAFTCNYNFVCNQGSYIWEQKYQCGFYFCQMTPSPESQQGIGKLLVMAVISLLGQRQGQNLRQKCQILMETLNPHISGLERAFDKIQKPKIIYWEVAISPKGQNNSISCFNNSISCLTKEPYYHNISGQK